MDAASTAAAVAAAATPASAPAASVQVPRGQVDLIDFIDWTGVECLNQDSSHSIVNALKQVGAAFPPTQTLAGLAPPSDSICTSLDFGGGGSFGFPFFFSPGSFS